MNITLAGMEYRCHSPSLFELTAAPGPEGAWVAFSEARTWLVGIRGNWCPQHFPTRQEAAQAVADGFAFANGGNLA